MAVELCVQYLNSRELQIPTHTPLNQLYQTGTLGVLKHQLSSASQFLEPLRDGLSFLVSFFTNQVTVGSVGEVKDTI
jgi:hypothetical protein